MSNKTVLQQKNEKKNNDIWFPAKKYGIGWGMPITWQGRVVLLSYFVLVFIGGFFIRKHPILTIPFVIYVLILTGILIFICFKKGEKPEIRLAKK